MPSSLSGGAGNPGRQRRYDHGLEDTDAVGKEGGPLDYAEISKLIQAAVKRPDPKCHLVISSVIDWHVAP